MPTLAEFRFLAGRLHTTPWGSQVNEGVVEWPPAPWRLLRALLATWHLKASDEIPRALMQSLIGQLAAQPPCYQLPRASTGHTRHYMPFNEGKNEKTTKVFDTFVALEKDAPLIVQWETDLAGEERTALDLLLTRLAYLGRAESLVEARLLPAETEFRADSFPLGDDMPLPAGTHYLRLLTPLSEAAYRTWLIELSVTLKPPASATVVLEKRGKLKKETAVRLPAPDDLFTALHADTGELQAAGWLAEPPGARLVYYARPANALSPQPTGVARRRSAHLSSAPTVARYAIASSVLPRIAGALSIGERVHQALLSRFKDRPPPETLLGRDASGQPLTEHAHAHIFCETKPGTNTISHITIYAKGRFDADAQYALRSLNRLWGHGGHDIELVLLDLGTIETFPDSPLFRSARQWVSLTPFISTRHPKSYRDGRPKMSPEGWQIDSPEHEIRRSLGQLSLPLPSKIEPLEASAASGRPLRWHDFTTHRHHGGGRRAHQPARGFRLTFPDAIKGPLALGYGAHFGLGLFASA